MRENEPDRRAPGGTSASAAWLAVSDAVLRGVNHAMSNRLAALGAIARVMDGGQAPGSLAGILLGEIDNLERTARLLHLLPRRPGEEPEPLLLADLLPEVLALHRLQGGLDEMVYRTDGDPQTLPVWGERWVLTHALLMLLNGAARAAQLRGEEVGLRYGGDEDAVTLVIEPAAPTTVPGAEPAPFRPEDLVEPVDAAAVALLLHETGAELTAEELAGDPFPGIRYTLRMPTLLAARRAESGSALPRKV